MAAGPLVREGISKCFWCQSTDVAANMYCGDGGNWYVSCGDCGGNGPEHATKDQAIKQWNVISAIVADYLHQCEEMDKKECS